MKLLNDMCTIIGGDADHIQLRLNAAHPIYQAHFPGNPITPGVCIVQMVGELLGRRFGRMLYLQKIVNLKFVSTISPVANPVIEVCFTSVTDNDSLCSVKGSITSAGELKTKFSIIYG